MPDVEFITIVKSRRRDGDGDVREIFRKCKKKKRGREKQNNINNNSLGIDRWVDG